MREFLPLAPSKGGNKMSFPLLAKPSLWGEGDLGGGFFKNTLR